MKKIACLVSVILLGGWNGDVTPGFITVLLIAIATSYSVIKEKCYE